ncbi:hypothetical protein BIW11_14347 [Tropilaelaps mercedesae]|uniref:Uncharacterized protein n=1 Tax=Tropilaelaps mercedesae TaxID=418985 RepID=A0A1V9WY14_9ACAR|nr:hypothetical protein BIW11_14347 [Tropilaelaps mercedesae]
MHEKHIYILAVSYFSYHQSTRFITRTFSLLSINTEVKYLSMFACSVSHKDGLKPKRKLLGTPKERSSSRTLIMMRASTLSGLGSKYSNSVLTTMCNGNVNSMQNRASSYSLELR